MKVVTQRQLREEAIVRYAIRRAINEGRALVEAPTKAEDDDYDATHDEFGYPKENPDERSASTKDKRRKNSMVGDVGGAELEEIAEELGFSVSGAKQAVDKALKKAQFLASLEDSEREGLVLYAIKDYINELEGAIDDKDPEAPSVEDIQLMYDNPKMVAELDGFREFLHSYVKRFAKAKGQKIS